MANDFVVPPEDFVPPREPRYVDRFGKPRLPHEFEAIEHRRQVIFVLAKHCDWGKHLGDRLTPTSDHGMMRVTMRFERGQSCYLVTRD